MFRRPQKLQKGRHGKDPEAASLIKSNGPTTPQSAQEAKSDSQPLETLPGAQPAHDVDKSATTKQEDINPDGTIAQPEKTSEEAEKKQPDREKTTFELELEARIDTLVQEGKEYREQNKNLLDERQTLNERIDSLNKANRESSELARNLEVNLKAAENEVEFFRADNETLRTYIVTKHTELQPSQPEDYYIENFLELRTGLEMWIVKQAKTNAATDFSDAEVSKLLGSLTGLGFCGNLAAQNLSSNNTVQKLYGTMASRIQLIRHIVAVFLYDQVFGPFAVGLSRELSEALVWIENNILSQERQFNETLMIHQSLGLGAVRYSQQNGQYESDINEALVGLLRQLVPRVSDNELYKNTSKFVAKAISLKKAMIQEQAVYKCYWVKHGDQCNPEFIEAIGEGTGPVFFCTFPGLQRYIKKDNVKSEVPVVRACAVVQNSTTRKG